MILVTVRRPHGSLTLRVDPKHLQDVWNRAADEFSEPGRTSPPIPDPFALWDRHNRGATRIERELARRKITEAQ